MNELTSIKQNMSLVSLSRTEFHNQIDGEMLLTWYLEGLDSENTKKQYAKAIVDWYNYLCIKDELERVMLKDLKVGYAYATEYINGFNADRMSGEIATSTYNSKIKGVRSFYKWLRLHTTPVNGITPYILINPFDAVELKPESDSKGSFALTPDEVILMLNNPYGKTDHLKERNKLILELALTTGLRNTTLIKLKFDEIQMIENCFVIDKLTKGHTQTYKPITNYYERIVNWYKYDLPNRAVDNGTIFNMHQNTANDMIKKWVDSVKINKTVTFHGLRATCAIQIYHTNGENEYGVQSFLNHKNVEVTKKNYLGKEVKIDHSGENAMEIITSEIDINNEIDSLSQEQLVRALKSLPIGLRLQALKMVKGA